MKINNNGVIQELKIKASDTLPVGSIVSFAGTVAPSGWIICDGSAISRSTYSQLFDKIGTLYGDGDGVNTFNLPNLKGKVLVGKDIDDNDFIEVGKTGGEKTHTLTVSEMPSHNHNTDAIIYTDNNAAVQIPSGVASGWPKPRSTPLYATKSSGGGSAHNNLQPYLTVNYIIKYENSIGVVGKVLNLQSDSQSDTYSCDYINRNTSWKYLGTATGQRAGNLILPEGWVEAMVYAYVPRSDDMVVLSAHILSAMKPLFNYTGTYEEVYFGCGASAITGSASGSTVQGCTIALTKSDKVWLNYAPGYTGSTKIYVYYR